MNVVIMGDTHVPTRATSIPEWALEAAAEADHVVHTGDFDTESTYEEIREAAPELTAVRGNMDPGGLGLPEVATLDVGDVRFVVTHGTGSPRGYEERIAETVAEHASADGRTIGVGGHTHSVLDSERRGYRLLNPGSATGARPATEATLMVADVDGGDVDIELRRGE